MIIVEELVKEYRVRQAPGGLRGLFAPQYRNIQAVDHVSFKIGDGEIVGYIGPNGAGKSTTIKIMTSILTPTSGMVRVGGMDPQADRKTYVKNIGAMFGQKTQLWWDLPLEDSYLLLKDMYSVPDKVYRDNIELFYDVLEIDQFMHQPVRQLSLGQRVRGDLAAVLLHNPKVVFLDEPTLGIDFMAKKKIREFIREVNRRLGTTVVLTSHDIADIESLCEKIIIINSGKLAYDGPLNALRTKYQTTRKLEVEFARLYDDFKLSDAELVSSEGNKKVFAFLAGISPSGLIGRISREYEVTNISIREPEIEDIIREIYQREEVA